MNQLAMCESKTSSYPHLFLTGLLVVVSTSSASASSRSGTTDEALEAEVTAPTSGASPHTEDFLRLPGSESLTTDEAREREASCDAALLVLCAEYLPSDAKLEEAALHVDPEYFLYGFSSCDTEYFTLFGRDLEIFDEKLSKLELLLSAS